MSKNDFSLILSQYFVCKSIVNFIYFLMLSKCVCSSWWQVKTTYDLHYCQWCYDWLIAFILTRRVEVGWQIFFQHQDCKNHHHLPCYWGRWCYVQYTLCFLTPTQVVLRNNFSFKFLVVTKNTRKLFRGVRILNCLSVKIFGLVIIHSGKGCQLRNNLLSSFSIDSNYIWKNLTMFEKS